MYRNEPQRDNFRISWFTIIYKASLDHRHCFNITFALCIEMLYHHIWCLLSLPDSHTQIDRAKCNESRHQYCDQIIVMNQVPIRPALVGRIFNNRIIIIIGIKWIHQHRRIGIWESINRRECIESKVKSKLETTCWGRQGQKYGFVMEKEAIWNHAKRRRYLQHRHTTTRCIIIIFMLIRLSVFMSVSGTTPSRCRIAIQSPFVIFEIASSSTEHRTTSSRSGRQRQTFWKKHNLQITTWQSTGYSKIGWSPLQHAESTNHTQNLKEKLFVMTTDTFQGHSLVDYGQDYWDSRRNHGI